jgi:NTE family protein
LRIGLVLGAGGTVGMAYHAGVLRALEQVTGYDPADADLILGTSAGSVVAAHLRCGWTTKDFWELAMGTHPLLAAQGRTAAATRAEVLAPLVRGPIDAFRRGLGSAYVLGRSVSRLPAPRAPAPLRRLFPGGLFSMAETRAILVDQLSAAWPDRPLWVCAVDLRSGRRIVLGRRQPPPVSLVDAVMASCAIPGFYQPVRVGSLTLVDGGVHSTTNLDLAAKAGCTYILGIAPMAFDSSRPPGPVRQLARRVPSRTLAWEMTLARRAGCRVRLIRPDRHELRVHGLDLMRADGLDRVALAAYESAARSFESDHFRGFFEALAAA